MMQMSNHSINLNIFSLVNYFKFHITISGELYLLKNVKQTSTFHDSIVNTTQSSITKEKIK